MGDDLRKATHASPKNFIRPHGVGLRGLNVPRGSEQFEGRFGRMFRTLMPAEHTDEDLNKLGAVGHMTAKFEATQTPETEADDEENVDGDKIHIPAGYTYFGQFVDHDITFDPASSLQKQNDPDALTDFRTPRFDLDSVYGRGPDDQPYLYDGPKRMLLGEPIDLQPGGTQAFDLPRSSNGRALIGDPRNDENAIVSQFQGIMLRFHNRVADLLGDDASFAEIQQTVRWHYQWAVLHDYLPVIAGEKVVKTILPHMDNGTSIKIDKPQLAFFKWRDDPFMPVEFSVAAYRFGHSMIRPIYRLNRGMNGSAEPRILIFADQEPSLVGFRPLDKHRTIEWDLFFQLRKNAPVLGKDRLQPAYKIDSSLVNPLGHLPPAVASNPAVLAQRNLLRGKFFGLPSGQTVARYMGQQPLTEDQLKVGKAPDDAENERLVDVSKKFEDNAPLWYYILAEAQHQHAGRHLGTVGGRIVAEVIIGLIIGDNFSYISQDPTWRPATELCRDGKNFRIADLVAAAIG
ncbi:MAG TPA: heme peroxidase family protein [Thermoanaerobaculia bacterium]|jgi:hypothetical protein